MAKRTAKAIAANTKFTASNIPKIAEEVCELLSIGNTLADALATKMSFPKVTTFYKWLDEYADVAKMYARAREKQQDYEADNIIKIADTEPDTDRARVRIDARKWRAAKMAPKKYGDKIQQEVTGAGGKDLFPTQPIDITQLSSDAKAALKFALLEAKKQQENQNITTVEMESNDERE